MLVQRRTDCLRLFAQHVHGWMSGRLAHEWRGLEGGGEALPYSLVVATGLHDLSWREADRRPLLNRATGQPHDFIDFPSQERLRVYEAGLDALTEVDPFCARLVSLHYCTIPGMEVHTVFQESERVRRQALARGSVSGSEDGGPDGSDEALAEPLAYLKLFDVLSLFIGLTPPAADRSQVPDWLDPGVAGQAPGGRRFSLTWRDGGLAFAPFPFRAPFEMSVTYRRLERTHFETQDQLDRAWQAAAEQTWTVAVLAG